MNELNNKLYLQGVAALSDNELFEVICGNSEKSNNRLLQHVERFGLQNRYLLTFKSGRILAAACEFVRRKTIPDNKKILSPSDLYPFLLSYSQKDQEHFIIATLNGAKELLAVRVITIGLANLSMVHPREVFAAAISDRACYIIAAHNHPSEELEPSQQDLKTTEMLKKSGELLGIQLLDHIIFSISGFNSIC